MASEYSFLEAACGGIHIERWVEVALFGGAVTCYFGGALPSINHWTTYLGLLSNARP